MFPSYCMWLWLCCKAWTTEPHLEPASGTPQSTRRSRSSQTLPRGSGGDTCPRFPSHEGRREESGSRSNIDLQPGRPVISPEIQQLSHTEDTLTCAQIYNAWKHPSPHPLRAHVHTLVHGHVLDNGAERKCQGDVVRPVETPFENGAAIWNRQKQNVNHQQEKIKTIHSSFHQLGLYSLTLEEEIPLGLSFSLLRPWPACGLNQ